MSSGAAGIEGGPSQPANQRLDSLTSLRWFAAMSVFAAHFDAIAGVLPGLRTKELISTGGQVLDGGYASVSFFFVLSGFVLTLAQLNRRVRRTARPFLRDRVARIYPLHIVTSMIAVFVMSGATVITAIPAFLALQAWIPRQRYTYALNVPSWSLSVEMFFYVCFPLALPLIERIRNRLPAIVGLVAITFALGFIPGAMSSPDANLWILTFPPARFPEFLIGILLALEIRDGKWRRIPMLPACALLVAVAVLEHHLPVGFSFAAATLVPVILVVLAAAGGDLRGRSSILHWRWLIVLGEWTFAFYVVHNLVLIRFAQVAGKHHWSSSPVLPFVLAAAVLLLCIACAAALHFLVEKPGQRFLMQKRRARVPA